MWNTFLDHNKIKIFYPDNDSEHPKIILVVHVWPIMKIYWKSVHKLFHDIANR